MPGTGKEAVGWGNCEEHRQAWEHKQEQCGARGRRSNQIVGAGCVCFAVLGIQKHMQTMNKRGCVVTQPL